MIDKFSDHNKILFFIETKTDIEISRSRFIRINSILRFEYEEYHNYILNEDIGTYFSVPIEL